MKRFMAVVELKRDVTPADTADYSAREAQRFKELFDAEVICEYYKKIDYPKFWCIIRSSSLEEAQAQLHSLPYYGKGLITIDIEELANQNKLIR